MRHPVVVFHDHGLGAGEEMRVFPMARAHMHSQVELNLVVEGGLTYRFDGRRIALAEGSLALFWGMIPHQVTEAAEPTRFVCLYMPMAALFGVPALTRLRDALFRGAMVGAAAAATDRAVFERWRAELIGGGERLNRLVLDEIVLRLRRLDHEGWRDLRQGSAAAGEKVHPEGKSLPHAAAMLRFVGENACEPIAAADVARAAGLHPAHAAAVFRRATGLSITRAILRQRLDTAQALLVATAMPVSDIAFESGFGSLSRFYEAFTRHFGLAPKVFRARVQEGGGTA